MGKTFVKELEPLEKNLIKKTSKHGLTMTVSGRAGVGKTSVSGILGKKFGLRLFSAGEIFREYAKKRNLKLEELSKTREKALDLEIDKKTLELAIKGNIILTGRLTGWVAGDWSDCRILVECSPENVINRVAKRDKMDVEKAKDKIEKRNRYDEEKFKKYYGIDIGDKRIYHVVFNTSQFKNLGNAKNSIIDLVENFLKAEH